VLLVGTKTRNAELQLRFGISIASTRNASPSPTRETSTPAENPKFGIRTLGLEKALSNSSNLYFHSSTSLAYFAGTMLCLPTRFSPVMSFCTVHAVSSSHHRICKRFPIFLKLSSSSSSLSALKAMDFIDETTNNDSSYHELHLSMQGHASSGNFAKALDFLNSMRNVPGKPTVYDFNALLYSYLKSQSLPWNGKIRPTPNSSTFNVLLNGKDVKPDMTTYNVILHELCLQDRVDEVVHLLDMIENKGFSPNSYTYAAWRRPVKNRGCYVDVAVYNIYFHCLCHENRSKEALYLLKKMMEEDCLKLLDYMTCNGSSPTIVTFNVLLGSLCKNGLVGIAQQVFKHLRNTGFFPDKTSYNILIHAFIREGNKVMVNQLVNDMYSQGLKPDLFTYGSLISGLCKEGKASVALKLRDEMVENGLAPSIVIYNTLLEAMFQRGQKFSIIFRNEEVMDCYLCFSRNSVCT
ncbi:Pentatricopeptide repeat superfamily protein, partial [Prunus dulcis]